MCIGAVSFRLTCNGICCLVFLLQLEYFETILNPYFTSDARESLKSLQGVLLEKATESVAEAAENPGHNRRPTRGSEEAVDERQGATAPDELIVRIIFLHYIFFHFSLFFSTCSTSLGARYNWSMITYDIWQYDIWYQSP